jgi:seryl-tRNA synthetase
MDIDREKQELEDEIRSLNEDIRIMKKKNNQEIVDEVRRLAKEMEDLKNGLKKLELFLVGVLKDIVFSRKSQPQGWSEDDPEDDPDDPEEDQSRNPRLEPDDV